MSQVAHTEVGIHRAVAVIALLLCVLASISSARAGLSRLFSEYGSATNSLAAATRALDLNAADPEAHYVQAMQLEQAERSEEAVAEFERAASLRPADYFLWQ